MKILKHAIRHTTIAELNSEKVLIEKAEDGTELLGNLYYQGFDSVIIHKENITPAFFDLKNGLAGEVLQKFSNYRFKLAIVGDFTEYTKKSIRDFIYESNTRGHINFITTVEEALSRLSGG